MSSAVRFRPCTSSDKLSFQSLFDANCPEYFPPNEGLDCERFLDENLATCGLCTAQKKVASAFGLMGSDPQQKEPQLDIARP
jgi:hypothetical protein